MKNVPTNIAALLLVLWYSLSVIGFDVHTCSTSGESYIATVIGGTACEDIHPEHQEKKCSCCHHGQGDCHDSGSSDQGLSTKPCCSDHWQMIVLTGVRTSEGNDHFDEYICGLCPCILDFHAEVIHPHIDIYGLRALCKPDSGDFVPLDVQRAYNIWRI